MSKNAMVEMTSAYVEAEARLREFKASPPFFEFLQLRQQRDRARTAWFESFWTFIGR